MGGNGVVFGVSLCGCVGCLVVRIGRVEASMALLRKGGVEVSGLRSVAWTRLDGVRVRDIGENRGEKGLNQGAFGLSATIVPSVSHDCAMRVGSEVGT